MPFYDRRNTAVSALRRACHGICSELVTNRRYTCWIGAQWAATPNTPVLAPRRFSGLRAIDFPVPYALPFGAPPSIGLTVPAFIARVSRGGGGDGGGTLHLQRRICAPHIMQPRLEARSRARGELCAWIEEWLYGRESKAGYARVECQSVKKCCAANDGPR